MKIIYFIFLLLFFSSYFAKSQNIEVEEYSKNLIFIEAFGYGGYGSLNYGYTFLVKNKLKVAGRIGLGTYYMFDYSNNFNPDIIIPLGISGYYGESHNVGFGFGQTISNIVYADNVNYQPKRETCISTNFTIGYRYQKREGGIMFRIAYMPIIEKNRFYAFWGGISLGYAF